MILRSSALTFCSVRLKRQHLQLQKFLCRTSDARELMFLGPLRTTLDNGIFPLRLLIQVHLKFLQMLVTSRWSFTSPSRDPRGPVVVRTPKGSVGAALLETRRRQNMLGAVEVPGHQANDTETRRCPRGPRTDTRAMPRLLLATWRWRHLLLMKLRIFQSCMTLQTGQCFWRLFANQGV